MSTLLSKSHQASHGLFKGRSNFQNARNNQAVNRSTLSRGYSNQSLPFVPGYGNRYFAEDMYDVTSENPFTVAATRYRVFFATGSCIANRCDVAENRRFGCWDDFQPPSVAEYGWRLRGLVACPT